MSWKGVIEQYREYLPVTEATPVITMLEGNTPLVPSRQIVKQLNADVKLYFKCEGFNPTGSFKDRGMTVAVSKAVEEGSQMIMCASTGNTSASAAAYAGRLGMKCVVLVPEAMTAMGKLAQALIHGAQVLAIQGNFDDALKLVRKITEEHPITLVNSLNPYRIEGQKTGAFEICDVLGGRHPDFHAIPVGNAGNITAYWKGYKEYLDRGRINGTPVMLGFQAAGAAPIVEDRIIESPQTFATAIRIGRPASWEGAVNARDESGGLIDKVTDDEIREAYRMLAHKEGIFVEPASAASVAGVLKMDQQGYFSEHKGATIVCVLTGFGLKDPNAALETACKPSVIEAKEKAVLDKIGIK